MGVEEDSGQFGRDVRDVEITENVVVLMRDGVELRADVYLPRGNGQVTEETYSTVLVRTSYDKSIAGTASNIDPLLFASRGHAVVLQDVRGRYKSDGVFYHGINETEDGADTLEWIAGQPWSNGKVGMTGISYLAAVQCAAALSGSPYLKSMFHVKAPVDYYQNGNRHGGNVAMYMAPVTFFFASTGREAQHDPVVEEALLRAFHEGRDWLAQLPLKQGLNPLAASPGIESWLIDIMTHAEYDEFWTRVKLWQPAEYVDEYADIPGFYVSGWYDMYREPEFYELLASRKNGPIRLLMGPWTHLDFSRVSGDVDFGPEAELSRDDYFALQLDWFDETLRDAPRSADPPVRIFVMGGGDGRKTPEGRMNHGGRWRNENGWPIARAEILKLHFHQGALLSAKEPPADSPPTRYVHNPERPVPTIGGVNYFLGPPDPVTGERTLLVPHGGQDQREQIGVMACTTNLPLVSRQDVVVFQTDVLGQDVEITGVPEIVLWFASSAVDTDFVAKLVDVYPRNKDYCDGYALNVSEGVMRARYRDSYQHPEFLTPGEVSSCRIRLYPTSNLFKAGHRIRIQLASSDYPAYDSNPGTGGTLVEPNGPPRRAENTIFTDAVRTSHVLLPVIRGNG